MQLEFTRDGYSAFASVPAQATWSLPITGQAGVLTVNLPYNQTAASATYINPDGGSSVSVVDDGYGVWRGTITQLNFTPDYVTVTAVQPWSILANLAMPRTDAPNNTSTGFIASLALLQAQGALGLSCAETMYDFGPHITSYQFQGQSVWDVLLAMMELSGDELQIDADTLVMEWAGSDKAASLYSTNLLAGVDIYHVEYSVTIENRLTQAVGMAGTDLYVQWFGENGTGWPASATVNAGSLAEIVPAVNAELTARYTSERIVGGQITTTHKDIREGQWVNVTVPYAEFGGVTVPCRVLSRTVDDASTTIALTLQAATDGSTAPRLPMAARSGLGSLIRGDTTTVVSRLRRIVGTHGRHLNIRNREVDNRLASIEDRLRRAGV